jgi:DNA processing protein
MLDKRRLTGIELSDRQKIAWLRLIRSENIGPISFRDLVNRFGSAQNALDALPDIARRGGAKQPLTIFTEDDAGREIEHIERFGAKLIGIGEPHYPPELRHIDAPPPLITIKGQIESLIRPMVGIVGSRNASINGAKFAAMLARDLSADHFTIASGLARGIDTAAHRGALQHGTVAMLAGGIDQPYPSENIPLLDEFYRTTGASITEMPFGWVAKAIDFPRRNRLIAGCALGLIVVEAAMRSGSLITARLAANFGRLVFAVPGSPLDPRSHGTNALIREGATLITSAEDVLEALQPLRQKPLALEQSQPEEDGEEIIVETNADQRQKIILSLSPVPSAVDDIIRITEIEASVVQMALLELELAGKLSRHMGGRVSLRVLH